MRHLYKGIFKKIELLPLYLCQLDNLKVKLEKANSTSHTLMVVLKTVSNNSVYFTWYGNVFPNKMPEIVNLAAILYMLIRQPKTQNSVWEPG